MTAITTTNSLSALNAQALIDKLPEEKQVKLSRLESSLKDTTKDIVQLQTSQISPETTKTKDNKNLKSKYKKAGILRKIGGFLLGNIASVFACIPLVFVNRVLQQKVADVNKISSQEHEKVIIAAEKALSQTGLRNEGVSIERPTKENEGRVKKYIDKMLDSYRGRANSEKQNKRLNRVGASLFDTLKQGANAFYAPSINKVFMPEKSLSLATFHEIGHAANKNFGFSYKLMKNLHRYRGWVTLPTLIFTFKPPKAPDQKQKGWFDKTTDFVKNNAGKIIFMSFIPLLWEEGTASIKGNRFAKEVLSPELYKKVKKTNRYAYLTYLSLATTGALSYTVAGKASDLITKPRLKKKKKIKNSK